MEREKPGFVCATRWEAAEAVSSSNVQPEDGKYSPALPPPSTGTMPTSLLLPGKLPTWKELSRVNPCWSYHSGLPLLCSAPGFSSDIDRDSGSCCRVSFSPLCSTKLESSSQWL